MKFKDLKLDELSQDDQIRAVRKVLKAGNADATELMCDEELDPWLHDNMERILELIDTLREEEQNEVL